MAAFLSFIELIEFLDYQPDPRFESDSGEIRKISPGRVNEMRKKIVGVFFGGAAS
jgi:hypothetical protein